MALSEQLERRFEGRVGGSMNFPPGKREEGMLKESSLRLRPMNISSERHCPPSISSLSSSLPISLMLLEFGYSRRKMGYNVGGW